jgi:hypothetical protein
MASAMKVVGAGPDIARLDVEDDTGERWSYVKGTHLDFSPVVHVQEEGGLLSLRSYDGRPVLRQPGRGLPPKIIVSFSGTAGPRMVGVAAGWLEGGGYHEYNQE